MRQIIRAEREAQEAAREAPDAGSEPPSQAGEASGADQERVRKTVILVPGPAIWRIRGSLTAAKGMLALEDADGVLWYLPGLDRYVGYIEGLDAGEEAVLEGYAPSRGSSQERYFQPLRLFIDEMEYDLAVPPEGIYLGGRNTVIREIGRRSDAAGQNPREEKDPPGDRSRTARPEQEDGWYEDDPDEREDVSTVQDRRPRKKPAGARPAWEHNHRSPWAPPASVLDSKADNDSFWRDDPAARERDSREIWY
jgi:hypothetical protein